MKYLSLLALLAALGCAASEPESEPAPKAAPPANAELKAQLNLKKTELAQADNDLAKINAERQQLAGQPASDAKTNRLVEIARVESETKQKKASLGSDIADLNRQLGLPASTAPSNADSALDDLLAAGDKEKEEAARRKQKADEETAGDKARIAEAEAARKAELDERAKQKVAGGRAAAGGEDGAGYEERWADVIQSVRTEIQKYKRW